MDSETNTSKGTVHYFSSSYMHDDGCPGFSFASVIDPGPGYNGNTDYRIGVAANELVKSTVWNNAETAGRKIVWGRPNTFGTDGPDGSSQEEMPDGWSVVRTDHSLDIKQIEKEVASRMH